MKPSDELALFYVQEEIAKELRAKGYTIMDGDNFHGKLDDKACKREVSRNDDETNGSKWPTIFAGGKVDKVETVKPVKAELKALEAPEETPKEKKLVKRVLIAIASAALVTVLPFG